MYRELDRKQIDYYTINTGDLVDTHAAALRDAAKKNAGKLKGIHRSVSLEIDGPASIFNEFSIDQLSASPKISDNPAVVENLSKAGENPMDSFSLSANFLPTNGSVGGVGTTLIDAHGNFQPSTPFRDFAEGMNQSSIRITQSVTGGKPSDFKAEPNIPALVARCLSIVGEPGGTK